MNTLDIILLLCLLPGVIQGFRKGLISQIIGIAAILLSVWISYKFSTPIGTWISGFIAANATVIHVLSFVLIFLVLSIVLGILGRLVEKIVKLVMLGWLNRLLGVVFAIVKYILLAGVIVVAFEALNAKLELVSQDVLSKSVIYETIKDISGYIFPYLKGLLLKN